MLIKLEKSEHGQVSEVQIRAPAKLNLYLDVLGKRPDGYHEIETLMCPISLYDQVTVWPTSQSEIVFNLEVDDPGTRHANSETRSEIDDPAWQIPVDSSNLVYRAAELIQQGIGTKLGCEIHLKKRIPAAAGLGGGSSDAAATAVACQLAWGQWDRDLAESVCAALGSDIPFFLGDPQGIGMAWATGRGENCQLLYAKPALEFLVTHPPAGCSTRDVYANFHQLGGPRGGKKIIEACKAGQTQKIGAELFNALQSSASSSSMWVERQLKLLSDNGQRFVLMTGSGSSCFALLAEPMEKQEVESIVQNISSRAWQAGIRRVYHASAWYAESIERQLSYLL